MFWQRKQHEAHFQGVRVNDRVQVDIAGRSYMTRVEDVTNAGLHLAAPNDHDKEWQGLAKQHEKATVNVFSDSGFRRFATKVTDLVADRVPLVVLSYVKDLGSLDRRQYDRVSAELQVRYRVKAGPDSAEPWSSSITSDVSGSGLRVLCDGEALMMNDYLDVQLLLAPDGQPVRAVAQVVRIVQPSYKDNKPSFGLHFVLIQQPDRARIIHYVKARRDWQQKMRRQYEAPELTCPSDIDCRRAADQSRGGRP